MYLVFDIGASKIRLACSEDGKSFAEPRVLPTPVVAEEVVALVKKEAAELLAGETPQAVCGGLTRKLYKQVADGLKQLFPCPVHLQNDTALVGLGEAVAGAGTEDAILAYITISTGVGGVRIVDRRIDRHVVGFEPGHQIINFLEPDRSWEHYISGSTTRAETGKNPWEITDTKFWEEKARLAAFGIYNTILHWSPDSVVLGGGMMKTPGISLDAVSRYLQSIKTILPSLPPLRRATLGDFGGLHGALHFLSQL